MHDGTKREIRGVAGLGKRDRRGLGWIRMVIAEIASWRAEKVGLNLVKCRRG
jgi:hypothetical protein